MSLIDLILNLAGLLLWISWRAVPFDPMTRTKPATLPGTLRRAEPTRVRPWHFLIALVALLVVRAVFYWLIGPALDWTAGVKLGAISISFRSDHFGRMLIFSAASFAHSFMIFYLWLLLLSLVNPRSAEADSGQRFLRIQLGFVHSWPWLLKLLLPLVAALLIWLLTGYLLGVWGIVPAAQSWVHRLEQGVVLGLGTYLVWKYVIAAVLGLHLLNTYVYLGGHPAWNFINTTARRLLTPLRSIPLRIGKVDFAPVVVIALVFVFAELAGNGVHKKLPVGHLQIDIPGLVDIYRKISN